MLEYNLVFVLVTTIPKKNSHVTDDVTGLFLPEIQICMLCGVLRVKLTIVYLNLLWYNDHMRIAVLSGDPFSLTVNTLEKFSIKVLS